MAVALGANSISNAMLGITQVTRMYLGTTLVWEKYTPEWTYTLDSNNIATLTGYIGTNPNVSVPYSVN